MSDNILDLSIKQAGGVGKLAQSLGVRQNVVSNWKARKKVPLPWLLLLESRLNSSVENQNEPLVALPSKELAHEVSA